MATDFLYGGKQIVASGPFKPSGKNMPVDARTRVEVYADIESIPNPFIGMRITVLADETNNNKMTDYIVKSLKANASGFANTVINEVVRYVDYLGVSSSGGGTSSGTGAGLTSEQAQQLQTAYTHSQSTHVQASDLLNIDAVSLNGKKISEAMTKEEYDALLEKDPNTIYLVNDDAAIEGIPIYSTSDANKVLAVNSDGTAIAWMDVAIGSGSGLTTEQAQQLTTAYEHSQSTHVQAGDIPTKVSQLENDSNYVTNTEMNEAIANVSTGGGLDSSGYYTKAEIDAYRPLVKSIADNVWSLITLDDGTETFTNILTHNLGTTNLSVSFYDSDSESHYCSYKCIDENNIEITNDEALALTVVIFHGGINTSISTSGTGTGTSYANQTWTFIGDSITYGIGTTKTYHQYLKEKLELGSAINLGVNGKSLSPTMANDIETASTITNAVFVFGGTNDFYGNVPLGEYYTTDESGNRTLNTDTSTFRGALISICNSMYSRFPDALHVLLTPIHRELYKGGQLTDLQKNTNGNYLEEYVQSVIEVGKIMSVKVIDLYSLSGLQPNNAENKAKYFSYDDGLHPIAAGHEKICNCIINNL